MNVYTITKWCKSITDSGKDEYTKRKPRIIKHWQEAHNTTEKPTLFEFRLIDDDGTIYCYGVGTNPDSFVPLDRYGPDYGCTEIQWKNDAGKWETL